MAFTNDKFFDKWKLYKKGKKKKKCKGDTMASWFKDEDQKNQLVYDGTHLTQVKLTMLAKG